MILIVSNIGYVNRATIDDLIKDRVNFRIYRTNKNTDVLVKILTIGTFSEEVQLYMPKKDRLPYKIIEGKRITSGYEVFDPNTDGTDELDKINWNGGTQIMAYEEFTISY